IRLLLGDPVRASALMSSFHHAGAAEKPRKCPICLHRMEKVRVAPDAPNLFIDRCRRHGLWLDKGELVKIIKAHSFDAERKVEKMLADIFGDEQQEEHL
ncbi:MAG TPA: zf-TFIIB domain-containing protein, partial [Sedimentisphaerales bacterium]|nr:zf-TFIIB domain-containing protein [Sedimentisphaerales bacterium]